MKNNKFIISFTLAFTGILFTGSLLVASASYFNNKEIETLTSQCYQNKGEPTLEINNKLTNNYSFECNKSQI
ncbi:hypothetical protein [Solibacillus cecembensis]|uniref:hypothetical protein n=1 Tax=Solibacillus cecembensis TaxID=459347 RepID=UPI003CFBC763